jgi:curved DNA-binding protein CbpA
MNTCTHYDVLGLQQDATAAGIRKAYRQRAKHEHPDKGGSDEQFQRLQQAYEVLADAGSRQQYDRTVLRQREHQRRRVAEWKRKAERQAKQAAERARFVLQQRQRLLEQERAEAALGAQYTNGLRRRRIGKTAATGQQRRAAAAPPAPSLDGHDPRTVRSVYAGVTGMDGELADVSQPRDATDSTGADSNTAPHTGDSLLSSADAVRILHEGIRRWTTPQCYS